MRKRLWLAVSLLVILALLVAGCAGHPEGMKSLRWLTDNEKDRVIEIALNTREVLDWKGTESKYEVKLAWYAIVWRNSKASEVRLFGYDDVKTDPNYQLVSQSAVWYPGVTIHFEEPQHGVAGIQVAVDLKTAQAVYVFRYPFRTGPTPTKDAN